MLLKPIALKDLKVGMKVRGYYIQAFTVVSPPCLVNHFGRGILEGTNYPSQLTMNGEIQLLEHKAFEYSTDPQKIVPMLGRPYFVGADPEIFVVNGRGSVVNAWEFLGDKATAHRNTDYNYPNRAPLYWDGPQCEFAPKQETCLQALTDNVRNALEALNKAKPKGSRLSIKNVLPISRKVLQESDDKYITFGCKPSLNAYGEESPLQLDPRSIPIRFAGGHKHIGYKTADEYTIEAVKTIDAIMGPITVSLAEGIDDPRRRQYYGRAGEYRDTPYGFEYRVMSNFDLCHPAVYHLVYDLTRVAWSLGVIGYRKLLWGTTEAETRHCINTCDVGLAREIINRPRNLETLRDIMLQYCYRSSDWPAKKNPTILAALSLIQNGIIKKIPQYEDLVGNWDLGKEWRRYCQNPQKQWSTFAPTISL